MAYGDQKGDRNISGKITLKLPHKRSIRYLTNHRLACAMKKSVVGNAADAAPVFRTDR